MIIWIHAARSLRETLCGEGIHHKTHTSTNPDAVTCPDCLKAQRNNGLKSASGTQNTNGESNE